MQNGNNTLLASDRIPHCLPVLAQAQMKAWEEHQVQVQLGGNQISQVLHCFITNTG